MQFRRVRWRPGPPPGRGGPRLVESLRDTQRPARPRHGHSPGLSATQSSQERVERPCGSLASPCGGPTRSSSSRWPSAARRVRDPAHADRHLPEHQDPDRRGGLALHGVCRPRRWRTASCCIRALRADHRQRRRTHRIAVVERHRGRQVLLPAERQRGLSYAQITACVAGDARRTPGTTPPFILAYNAS